MIGVMFLLALFTWIVVLIIRAARKQDPGPGGWWGPGWGRGRDPGPRPSKPRDPGPNPDGLLEIPMEWIEAHGKWAKQVVRESRQTIKARR
jgi:hypothetical protein